MVWISVKICSRFSDYDIQLQYDGSQSVFRSKFTMYYGIIMAYDHFSNSPRRIS
jgi:hypothetical protein